MKKVKLLAVAVTLMAHLTATAATGVLRETIPVKLFKNPNCFGCELYAQHLNSDGFKVINTNDMAKIKETHGVPGKLEGCHTALIFGYVFEGLVPAQFVKHVLRERQPIKGLALPGMPVGAPGMPGQKSKSLTVYALDPGASNPVFGTF